MAHTIKLTQYTDPYCTWCWGSEPMLRHLQEAYGDQFTGEFVMGGLVEDSATFRDPYNGIGGEDWLQPIADHWVEASGRHGMPVNAGAFLGASFSSTWPSNVAYHAAKLQDSSLADRYLRRLREAVATEGRSLDQTDTLADLAEAVGLDRARFLADFGGDAEAEFYRDRLECMQRGAYSFRTFLLEVDGREQLFSGWRTFSQMAAVIDQLAGEHVDQAQSTFSDTEVLAFVERHESAAPAEVAEVFGVSQRDAQDALDRLVASGNVELSPFAQIYRTLAVVSDDAATDRTA